MAEKKHIDKEALELAYRAGIKSLKALGIEFGLSDAGIIKIAKREGWSRDLGAKIRARADARVSADAVSEKDSSLTKASEKQIIEANTDLQVRIRREHRGDIQRMRSLLVRFIGELEEAEKVTDTKERLSLQVRVAISQKIADTHRTVVAMEREHFGITSRFGDDENPAAAPSDPVELARQIAFLFATAINKGA